MKTILVIEDFMAVQQLLRETLESKGYKTLGAGSGNKAYAVLVNHVNRISLVLTDYHMPDMTGLDLIKRIRENPELENIPIVFLTEESGPEIISITKTFALNTWIKKPFRPDSLMAEIERIFQNSNS
jgi:two-component system, chemotaxis family, chemotaxis protein CheY